MRCFRKFCSSNPELWAESFLVYFNGSKRSANYDSSEFELKKCLQKTLLARENLHQKRTLSLLMVYQHTTPKINKERTDENQWTVKSSLDLSCTFPPQYHCEMCPDERKASANSLSGLPACGSCAKTYVSVTPAVFWNT